MVIIYPHKFYCSQFENMSQARKLSFSAHIFCAANKKYNL